MNGSSKNYSGALTKGITRHITAGLVGSCCFQKLRFVTVELGFYRRG